MTAVSGANVGYAPRVKLAVTIWFEAFIYRFAFLIAQKGDTQSAHIHSSRAHDIVS
jgi:hypothetical protein